MFRKTLALLAIAIFVVATPALTAQSEFTVRGYEDALNAEDEVYTFDPVAKKGVILIAIDLEVTFEVIQAGNQIDVTLPAGSAIKLDWPNITQVTANKSGTTRCAVYANPN